MVLLVPHLSPYLVPAQAIDAGKTAKSQTQPASSIDAARLALMKRAKRAQDSMEEQSALAMLSEWINKYPDDLVIRQQRGELYFFMQKYAECIPDYTEMTKSKVPKAASWSRWRLGETYEHLGKNADADNSALASTLLRFLVLITFLYYASVRGIERKAFTEGR